MNIPDNNFYTNQHLWVREVDEENWVAGITDYAQDLLGDVVFIDPPKLGTELVKQLSCGLVESVKTGSDLHAPMNGIVTEVNEKLLGNPELINDKPYDAWIFKFKPSNTNDRNELLSATEYKNLIDA